MNILIETDSKVLLDEELKKQIGESKNVITYTYKETSLVDILSEASYVSMFEEMKYLIVRNANFFGKSKLSDQETNALINYLEHPYPLTTIIFTTYEEVDKRKSIFKKISDNYISLKSPKGYELQEKTKNLIRNQGYNIDDNLVKYITDACLSNWDLINNEVKKFDLYYDKKGNINKEDVIEIISNNAYDNQFKFVDAVISKNAPLSFKLLDDLVLLKVEPLQLLSLLAREYRLMLLYKILESKRYSPREMFNELKLADWQLNKIRTNASKYHKDDLKDALVALADIDYQIKSGQTDKLLALQLFLISELEY